MTVENDIQNLMLEQFRLLGETMDRTEGKVDTLQDDFTRFRHDQHAMNIRLTNIEGEVLVMRSEIERTNKRLNLVEA